MKSSIINYLHEIAQNNKYYTKYYVKYLLLPTHLVQFYLEIASLKGMDFSKTILQKYLGRYIL